MSFRGSKDGLKPGVRQLCGSENSSQQGHCKVMKNAKGPTGLLRIVELITEV